MLEYVFHAILRLVISTTYYLQLHYKAVARSLSLSQRIWQRPPLAISNLPYMALNHSRRRGLSNSTPPSAVAPPLGVNATLYNLISCCTPSRVLSTARTVALM